MKPHTTSTSIVVPVFNEELFLPKLLDSLVKQTHQPEEIIICDNGSTDQSIKVAKSYAKLLPLKIIHETKKGIIPTMEKAWRSTKGDIIIRTDADAILSPQYIQQVLLYLAKHPNSQAVTGPVYNAEKERLGMSVVFWLSCVLGNYLLKVIRGYPIILGPNSVFRRSILQTVDGYQSNQPTIDDQLITNKIHKAKGQIDFSFQIYSHHSSRRWDQSPKALLYGFLSLFNPAFYHEKSH